MNISIARIGYWSALVAFVGAAGYSVVQILQIVGLLTYPLDEILIFGVRGQGRCAVPRAQRNLAGNVARRQ